MMTESYTKAPLVMNAGFTSPFCHWLKGLFGIHGNNHSQVYLKKFYCTHVSYDPFCYTRLFSPSQAYKYLEKKTGLLKWVGVFDFQKQTQ